MDDTVSEVKRVAKKVQKNPVVRNLEKRAVKKGADFLRGALPRVPERVGMRMKRLWWLWAVCAAAAGGVLFTRLQLTQTARRSSHTYALHSISIPILL